METYDVIVIGAGPAGSSCAWQLNQQGFKVLIVDKSAFPRIKLCAGWITPFVFKLLQIKPTDYPYGLLTFKRLHFRFKGRHLPLPTRQYSVRRYEFDRFLLERGGAEILQHTVKAIEQSDGGFVIDGKYTAQYLIGAGGTHCPVYRTFFKDRVPRDEAKRIITIEEEFAYDYSDDNCYLWFFEDDLPGYAWYVPKANGYLNVGIGGGYAALKRRGQSIHEHWQRFIEKLSNLNLVRNHSFARRGYTYYLRSKNQTVYRNGAFLVGDAAGLATLDMGEGISAAIQSGLLAAQAIINGRPESYSINNISRFSLFKLLFTF
ncbi:MAG TPA: NAD(P)/FAD-dependent oxidoreductase [Calditrichaeota bacterium]|nr:NAD(P)/FAD-dependent oxidoreductase [Calditrichota bacterium]